jgi:hypothetical protein
MVDMSRQKNYNLKDGVLKKIREELERAGACLATLASGER